MRNACAGMGGAANAHGKYAYVSPGRGRRGRYHPQVGTYVSLGRGGRGGCRPRVGAYVRLCRVIGVGNRYEEVRM